MPEQLDAFTLSHLIAACAALILGAIVLIFPKGTVNHKFMGRLWVTLMVIVSVSSFSLHDLNSDGSLSWIHGLSAFTLFSLVMAVFFIKRGNIRAHQGFMIGTYCGLLGAGIGTLFPDRLVHEIIISLF